MRDFTLADAERFLVHWHRLVAVGQMGPGENAEVFVTDQPCQRLQAIRGKERIRERAIYPLWLLKAAVFEAATTPAQQLHSNSPSLTRLTRMHPG